MTTETISYENKQANTGSAVGRLTQLGDGFRALAAAIKAEPSVGLALTVGMGATAAFFDWNGVRRTKKAMLQGRSAIGGTIVLSREVEPIEGYKDGVKVVA